MNIWALTAHYWYASKLGWMRGWYTAKHRYAYTPWWDATRAEQIGTRLLNAPLHRKTDAEQLGRSA